MKRNKKSEDDIESSLELILKALTIIHDLKDDRGKIKCPKCGGELHYSRAKTNGHVWGQCTTEGCLSWMM